MTPLEQIMNMSFPELSEISDRAKFILHQHGYGVQMFQSDSTTIHNITYIYVSKAMRAMCKVSVGDP